MSDKGCAFGQVTRQKVLDLSKDMDEIKNRLISIDNKIQDNCNHLSNRLPIWATFLITALFSAVVGLIIAAVK